MNIMNYFCYSLSLLTLFLSVSTIGAEIHLGQGTVSGEATDSTALVQTRLTAATELDAIGDLPGAEGVVCFEWGTQSNFSDAQRTVFRDAAAGHDFIVRQELSQLRPNTRYYYRAIYGASVDSTTAGPTCSFKTLPGAQSGESVRFIVGSCMNYNKFMHGKGGNADGPVTATAEDKRLGFPSFEAMLKWKPDFFVGTGDIVYYDNPLRQAETISELRLCWHEQFRFPRMVNFFQHVPAFWSKDDHDFRFNDSDNDSDRLPLPKTGIDLFREQLPIVSMNDNSSPTFRTYRVNKQLQVWFSEGRDFRSPNRMKDGPEKSLWGVEQRDWLQQTLKASDARWKILITPTPMVGPDDAKKSDNHANLGGFGHEANAFFKWLGENDINNFMTICGDRHWQYHSIHPTGVNEFACGALNDENSRVGVAPGDSKGTDPKALIQQPFMYPKPSGGFLVVTAGDDLQIEFVNDEGKPLYKATK